MFASQSEFNEHKNKPHENEIDVIRTKLEESLNSNFNQNFKSEIAKKIILNSLSSTNISVVIDEDFLQDHTHLNLHLKNINEKLNNSSENYYIGLVETLDDWKKKKTILKKPVIGKLVRFLFFVFYRILPKLKWYQFLTFHKSKRLLSKAEVLGRFVYNGFEICDFFPLKSNFHVFILKRKREPLKQSTSEGVLLKINRIGKNGKLFKVYKLRTMHPYSEYLHEYMIKTHGFNEKGKIKNDFRAAKWAKVFRKYWLDELPQILNVLKFQMKLVGIRPVSESYFNSLPKEIQKKRIHHKPGCIPPYVAHDFGTTKESVLEAELVYMDQKSKNPYTTDIKYFFVSIFKIVFKGKRSS
jgi:lipopolysaccharide/colanic/teichoic acid biosynthesis glycosyltransferase